MRLSQFLLLNFNNVLTSIECSLQFNLPVLLVLLNLRFLPQRLLNLVNLLLCEAVLVFRFLNFLSQIVQFVVLSLDKIATLTDLIFQLLALT